MDPVVENMQQAKLFARDRVLECACDLLTWKTTSILPEGQLRVLGKLLAPHHGDSSLNIAEGLVIMAALDAVIKLSAWKESAKDVLKDIQLQGIAKALNLSPGSDITSQILPGILRLQARVKELEGGR